MVALLIFFLSNTDNDFSIQTANLPIVNVDNYYLPIEINFKIHKTPSLIAKEYFVNWKLCDFISMQKYLASVD